MYTTTCNIGKEKLTVDISDSDYFGIIIVSVSGTYLSVFLDGDQIDNTINELMKVKEQLIPPTEPIQNEQE